MAVEDGPRTIEHVAPPMPVRSPARLGRRWLRASRALLAAARPRQWTKNILVFGAPATGSVLLEPASVLAAVVAFGSFCLAASGQYLINDVVDRSSDRSHPRKRGRPVAAGLVSPRVAGTAGAVLLVAALMLAFLGSGPPLLAVVSGYSVLMLAYTFFLRDIALFDLAAIAGGFLLRAVAGGAATGVPLSMWFLLVAFFGSLFLAAGKRTAELAELGEDRTNHRRVLGDYTASYLRYIQFSASTMAIAAYSFWAFEGPTGGSLWSGLSIIPFVLGIFRYGLLLETGKGGSPEEVVMSDPPLLLLGLSWVVLVWIGVYAL